MHGILDFYYLYQHKFLNDSCCLALQLAFFLPFGSILWTSLYVSSNPVRYFSAAMQYFIVRMWYNLLN